MTNDKQRGLPALTLVTGPSAAIREAAIAAVLLSRAEPIENSDATHHESPSFALILEGMPDGSNTLDAVADLPGISITRIAPGCMCCTGNLVMTVTLNRILRSHPDCVLISLASSEHLDQIRHFLTHPPYDAHLILSDDLHCD